MSRITAIVSSTNRIGVDAVSALLQRAPLDLRSVDVEVVHSSTEAVHLARQASRQSEIIMAVGGDGTVADVATGIFGSHAALAIVPAGSTNITARALGVPHQPAAALALVTGPHLRRFVDVGRSGDRSFLHIAGAGFDAELFKGASPVWKRRVGWLAYLPPAITALRLPPSRVSITVDGAKVQTESPLVLVANGGSIVVPQFRIHPGIAVDDGWLDLMVFTARSPGEVAATLASTARQRLDMSPHVLRHRAKHVRIEADPELAVQLDGDIRGSTPRDFSVAPASLEVITALI